MFLFYKYTQHFVIVSVIVAVKNHYLISLSNLSKKTKGNQSKITKKLICLPRYIGKLIKYKKKRILFFYVYFLAVRCEVFDNLESNRARYLALNTTAVLIWLLHRAFKTSRHNTGRLICWFWPGAMNNLKRITKKQFVLKKTRSSIQYLKDLKFKIAGDKVILPTDFIKCDHKQSF